MKKLFYISTLLIITIVSYLGITFAYEYNSDEVVNFEIIGPTTLYINVNTEYKEYGVNVTYNGLDISNKLKIESNVDMSKLGEYSVKYIIEDEYVSRKVIVIDKISPTISLNGGDEIYITKGSPYQEYGYTVKDNYDELDQSCVKIVNNVNINEEGTYEVIYSIDDLSGNTGTKIRKVIVKSSLIDLNSGSGNKEKLNSYSVSMYSNTITSNKFTSKGIYLSGYSKNNSSSYKIKLKNSDNVVEYEFVMSKSRNNYYYGNIDLSNIYNGTYDVYLENDGEERVLNKLGVLSRLIRSHIGDKLVTFIYDDNDNVSINISNFKYEYDIVIDPGHP